MVPVMTYKNIELGNVNEMYKYNSITVIHGSKSGLWLKSIQDIRNVANAASEELQWS